MILEADYTFNTLSITMDRTEIDTLLRKLNYLQIPAGRESIAEELIDKLTDWLYDPESILGDI